jgi:hypothetical protein
MTKMSRYYEPSTSPAMLRQRAGHIRYNANWQGTAITMQYERLAASMHIDPESLITEALKSHMRAVADLDFLITSVRRLLRVAEQARSMRLDPKKELKLAIRIFNSRWQPQLVNIRNALEHIDGPGMRFFPILGGGAIAFVYPGGQVDAGKLYIAAMKLHKAICGVIEPLES